MAYFVRYPEYAGPDDNLRDLWSSMIRVLEQRDSQMNWGAAQLGYIVSGSVGVTAARQFDAETATLAELRQVVGRLVKDFQGVGWLG